MALQSRLFAGDPKLEAAAVSDPAHILPGSRGPHVGKIQIALNRLDNSKIAAPELEATLYGKSTADAVLNFKKKRAVINFSYQSSADNIVGKMTMATLDREVAAAEKFATDPIIVPLDPPPRPIRPNLFFGAQRQGVTSLAFAPALSGFNSFNLFGAPSFLTRQVEIDEGDTATFQIVGGKGEQVFVESVRVGLLIDPADPLRLRAVLDVTLDSQTFSVKGVGSGATRIVVTKRGGIFTSSSTVSIGLVVNELTVEKLWRPKLDAIRIPPRQRTTIKRDNVLSVDIGAEKFSFDGSVDPKPQIQPSDFEIGFVQTLTASMMEAVYTDDSGGQRRIFESTVQRLPVRDSDRATPWTKPEAVKELSSTKTVHFEDRPNNIMPWQDKGVTLRSSTGSDKFITFFIARHKRTGQVTVLARAKWQTSWEYSFDFSKEQATPVGNDGVMGDVNTGPGPEQPILGGDTANGTLKVGFRP
jgi:hypothetical protein